MATKYDIIKSASGRSGIAEGMWEVLSKYAEPDYQRQIKADEENQRRYDLSREDALRQESKSDILAKNQQDDLRRNKNYQSDLFKWQEFEKDYNTAIVGTEGNPNKIKIINESWPDKDKVFNIRMPDGSVTSQSLPISTSNAVADEELGRINTHKTFRDEYLNSDTSRERRMEIYSQVKQTGLDAGMVLDSSIDLTNTEDKKYQSNREMVDYITSDDYLAGTGITTEEAEALKEQLSKGGISDAELSIINDFVSRKIKDKRKTKEFWEKLYNKSIEQYGKTKFETPANVRIRLKKILDMAEKQLGIEELSKKDLGGGKTIDVGSLTPEESNRFRESVKNEAGGDVAYNNLSDEDADDLDLQVYASMFPTGKGSKVQKTPPEKPEDERGFIEKTFDAMSTKSGKSKRVLFDEIIKEDVLQIKNRKGLIQNPLISERKNEKVLRDPISGKDVDRNTLLNSMKNSPQKYAAKGYVYDPNNVKSYLGEPGEGEKTFLIGYRKMSPKEALQTLNK